MERRAILEPGKYYHIYNRGIAGTNVFLEERNYDYFLGLSVKHIEPVAETFAYCLLRNHFHLLVRVKLKTSEVSETSEVSMAATRAFSNLFNAYAKAINNTYGRTGGLFEHRFRRLEVTSETYCLRLVHYIHFNPQKHGFVTDFRDYPYSSYRALLSDKPTRLQREHVLDWYGGRVAFDAVHQTLSDEKAIWALIMEDET